MGKSDRLFELIQLLRRAKKPVTAQWLAEELAVSERMVYRYLASLQSMQAPIKEEAGVGYAMRRASDLPPLAFTAAETEAIHVGLSLLSSTGDKRLMAAARLVFVKTADVPPLQPRHGFGRMPPRISNQGVERAGPVSLDLVREAVRTSRKILINYADAEGQATRRTILPVALFYYKKVVTIAAWCELRHDVRNFRVDRIRSGRMLDEYFTDRAQNLREAWEAGQQDAIKLLN